MSNALEQIIRRHLRPLAPLPTDAKPVLRKLAGVRAVMFDIYGTLLISASGDIVASQEAAKGLAFTEALAAVGLRFVEDAEAGVQLLLDEVATDHERARQAGVEYPEVDIVDVWRRATFRIAKDGLAARSSEVAGPAPADAGRLSDADLRRLACEYEMRVNPVWPMPGARDCLAALQARRLPLGVISNAQFLTIDLWRLLLGAEDGSFEFDEQLQYYSYQHGRGKPDLYLYRLAAEALAERGIDAGQAVYVGNDMLNDIMPARAVGFRTALFAGDARSLRRRADDLRVAGVVPDLVITVLSDLLECIY